MKKLFSFIFLALLPVVANAYDDLYYEEVPGYDAKIDGIYYVFPNQSEAKVSYLMYIIHVGYKNDGEIIENSYHTSDYSGDVVIPETVTYNDNIYRVTGINDYAFYNCNGLTSVTIPSSVTHIGENAFQGCTGLKDIYCLSEQAPEAANAFDYTLLADVTLHVPAGAEDLYKTTLPWSLCFENLPTGSIKINELNFPDYYFRSYLFHLSIGADGVLTEEERTSVKEMALYNSPEYSYRCGPIQSLKGIEFFTGLTKLSCKYLSFVELDLSNNTTLKELSCTGYNRYFKKLNVSGCTELEMLDCSSSYYLEEVNLSGCSALQSINCSSNNLTEIDVSGLPKLTSLYCNFNQLVELNVSGLTSLTTLECEANILTMLNVSGCSALTHLKYWRNKIKGAGMDALIESLPVTSEGSLCVYWNKGSIHDQNVMTTKHVAAAKAKGWAVRSYENTEMKDYAGIEPTVVITFTSGQMATIVLPTEPDASKGKYYRLDRVEGNEIVFEQELQPRAHVPYIIVPSEDFSIELGAMELEGLRCDTASVEGISFIGTFQKEEVESQEGFYIELIDTTPDCSLSPSGEAGRDVYTIGTLRAYLLVHWDDPYHPGGTKAPAEKMEIVLHDNGTGIESIQNSKFKVQNEDAAIYDFSGRRLSKPQRGVNIIEGRKLMVK